MLDTIKAKGSLLVQIFDENGKLKEERDINNLVVTVGKAYIADRITNTPTAMGWIGVGTGTTAAAAGDTALGAEVGTRVASTVSTVTTNVANDTKQFVSTFAAGNATGAITEAGIFNQLAAGGTMLSRTVFSVINKGALDSMTITWKITIL